MPDPSTDYDVLIAGGGPAGAACALACLREGWRVGVIERAVFPRDKVCGDCLNPDCWPVLTRLGVDGAIRELPHAVLRQVELRGSGGRSARLTLPARFWDDAGVPAGAEVVVRRRQFDAVLLGAAAARGADVRQGTTVRDVRPAAGGGFVVETWPEGAAAARPRGGADAGAGAGGGPAGPAAVTTRLLVAADGRHSAVARAAGLSREGASRWHRRLWRRPPRVGLQTHLARPAPAPPAEAAAVLQMRSFAGGGYGGIAPTVDDGGELNLAVAVRADRVEATKAWARAEFGLPADHPWRSVAPLDRAPARFPGRRDGLFLAGDAARVVEPFTGEGIYYALRTGELAAAAAGRALRGELSAAGAVAAYAAAHRRAYGERGRLWVNRLTRAIVARPGWSDWALRGLGWWPAGLELLGTRILPAARHR